jgi:flagellar motor switch protein FliN/FliY
MATPEMSDNNKDAIRELADGIKAGDDALNKLKVQNLDFILDIPLKVSVEVRVQYFNLISSPVNH